MQFCHQLIGEKFYPMVLSSSSFSLSNEEANMCSLISSFWGCSIRTSEACWREGDRRDRGREGADGGVDSRRGRRRVKGGRRRVKGGRWRGTGGGWSKWRGKSWRYRRVGGGGRGQMER